ncbi:dihydropteroate synthase [Plantibacter sp. Mn2098]|uniref:dihydropteroate synthase n=1 Tax=Plantibacter sp. Mn2098 TaxID=3395266 RepID=UPI003BBE8D0E
MTWLTDAVVGAGSPGSRLQIMGVVNVTPDSFSDGGRYLDVDDAIAHGFEMVADGADIVDIGGESTRPGAARVATTQELARVIPVIEALSAAGVRVSIDTMNADTARAAVAAGAAILNDVSGGLADERMAGVAAESGLPYIVSHWRGHSDKMSSRAQYTDAAHDVAGEVGARVDALLAQGVLPSQIVVDPGLGFSKNADHNWRILARLHELEALGFPVLVGASRKRFLGALLPEDAPMESRDLPTAVVSVLAAQAGAWGVRVHDVASTRLALDTLAAWQGGSDD